MNDKSTVQYHIDYLNKYSVNRDIKKYHIIHIYDTGRHCVTDNSGYWDSRHFIAWGFNMETMEKKNLGTHDAISFAVKPTHIRIYVDGSTLIKFPCVVTDNGEQDLLISEA